MKVNTKQINSNLETLMNNISEWQLNSLNFFAQLLNMSIYWQGGKTESFFSIVENQKAKTNLLFDGLNSIHDTFLLIVNKYYSKGDNIYFNEDNINKIQDTMKLNISNFTSISTTLNYLDYSFCNEEIEYLGKQKVENARLNNKILDMYNKYHSFYELILSSEEEIFNSINKIEITTIEEIGEKDLLSNSVDTIEFNTTPIESLLKKAVLFNNSINQNISDIKKILNNCTSNYESKNTDKIKSLIQEVNKNFSNMKKSNDFFISLVYKKIEKYNQIAAKAQEDLKDIV